MFAAIAKKIFGSVNDREISRLRSNIQRINDLEGEISKLSDSDLRGKTESLKLRVRGGESLASVLPESFAVVREASKRVLGMRHFDVQLIGGMALHEGKIAEMKTGEGKTLVATLPCYLNALSGEGVHVVTVNDYLAKRDSAWMAKLHEFLGLKVGCIISDMDDEERKEAYACDITYATNNELGFDYLRDNMKYSLSQFVQRGRNFAIVDEVDSVLVDEARTPLIISGPTNDNSKLYQEIDRLIPRLSSNHYIIDEKDRSVFLTEDGIGAIEKELVLSGKIEQDSSLYDPKHISIVHHVNQALRAHKIFKNGVDYIVKDGSVIIVDEFTGRMQEGRRFSDGMHQALEAKEGVNVKNENQTLASITFQNYFRLYKKLAGMTGTAATESVEFEAIYNLRVVEIPTNRGISRVDEDDEIYKNEQSKLDAIVKQVEDCHKKNQPILIGTVSIEKSEHLSKMLKSHKLPHSVLNAKYHEQEAEIIAQAGRPGAITIATNMAGRGTDIMLGGNPEMTIEKQEILLQRELSEDEISAIKAKCVEDKKTAIDAGGLYILGTERHENRRIDNQLRGRSGRQGDPGRSKFFLSLDDDLMRIFGSEKLQSVLSTLGLKDDEAITHPWITRTLANAQKKVEMRHYEIRKNLLKYDDVVNEQRKSIFNLRSSVISQDDPSHDLQQRIDSILSDINADLLDLNLPKNMYSEEYSLSSLVNEFYRIYGVPIEVADSMSRIEISAILDSTSGNAIKSKIDQYGSEIFFDIARQIFLLTIDEEWKLHLLSLDKLRHGINLRAYAQKDPLMEYKRDAFHLFESMMCAIEEKFISRIVRVELTSSEKDGVDILPSTQNKNMREGRDDPALLDGDQKSGAELKEIPVRKNMQESDRVPQDQSTWGNIARNEKCPCGSGKKYKHCHAKN